MNDELQNDIPDMTDAERNASTGKEEPWDFPDVGTMEEEKAKRITMFAPNILFLRLHDAKMKTSDKPNQFTGNYDTNIIWTFEVKQALDGDVMRSNGQKAQKDENLGFVKAVIWTNRDAVSQKKDGTPQDTRAIMTALMGLPSNASLRGISPGSMVNRGCRVTVEIGKKQDGSPKQLWKSWAPWKPTIALDHGVGAGQVAQATQEFEQTAPQQQQQNNA